MVPCCKSFILGAQMKSHKERLHQAQPRSTSLQHLTRLGISKYDMVAMLNGKFFEKLFQGLAMPVEGFHQDGSCPSRSRCPSRCSWTPIGCQRKRAVMNLICSCTFNCPQLEGSKRFDQRAAARQEGVLKWVQYLCKSLNVLLMNRCTRTQIKRWSFSPPRAQESEREAHKFKAKEALVLRSAPFAPVLPQQRLATRTMYHLSLYLFLNHISLQKTQSISLYRDALPVVQAPDLNTDRRAVERGEFEASTIKSFRFILNYPQARRRERDLKAEAAKALEMRQKQEEEMQEVKSFFNTTMHNGPAVN